MIASKTRGTMIRRALTLAAAALGIAMLLLAFGNGQGGRAEATGEGTFTATLTVLVEETQVQLRCEIRGTITGGGPVASLAPGASYDVAAEITSPRGGNDCFMAGDASRATVGRPDITGSFDGAVTAADDSDGMASGTFTIRIAADTDTLGMIETGEAGIVISCEEIDLATRPTAYTCSLVAPAALLGSDLKATITAMEVSVEEPGYRKAPAAGFGPDAGASFGNGLMVALAAAGALLLAGGALIAVRQRTTA